MVTRIHGFRIHIINPRIVVLPGIFDDDVTVTYVAATMQMSRGGVVSRRWHTDDVDGTLRDFAEKVTFKLDPDLHLDRFEFGTDEVHVQYWSAGADRSESAPTHIGTMSEAEYFRGVDRALCQHRDWCATKPQVAGRTV